MTDKKVIDRLLTADEVSTLLHIPKSTLYKLCTEGEIPVARIGKHWRFDRDRVDQWLVAQFEAQEAEVEAKKAENVEQNSDSTLDGSNVSPLVDKQIKSENTN